MKFLESFDFDVQNIVNSILNSSIEIEELIRRIPLHTHLQGETKSHNFSGDTQKTLDILSNNIIIKNLTNINCCSFLLSEENEDSINLNHGNYMVTFDPLDGSSNIDCNVCIGTIFSIYKKNTSHNILRTGRDILIAGYIIYGPATEAVIALPNKVVRLALNPLSMNYEYIDNITLKNKNKKIYSINEANSFKWQKDILQYINNYKLNKYTQRYIGSMVADVHRTLLYGGIFCYPADEDNKKGKLRLVYECFPMAYIFEKAGGLAITGNMSSKNILDIIPQNIHEKTPILLGTTFEIEKYLNILDILQH
jgi:fructose-1,6-bisphosphatase I